MSSLCLCRFWKANPRVLSFRCKRCGLHWERGEDG